MTDQLVDRPSTGESCVQDPIVVQLRIGNRLLREALVRLFGKARDFVLGDVNGAEDSADPAGLAKSRAVLITDAFESDRSTNLAETSEKCGGVKILLIGMSGDPNQFLHAVRSGISGYLMNDASAADIIAAARAPFRSEAYCSPRLCLTLFNYVVQQGTPPPGGNTRPGLTLRQERLIDLVAEGLTNKEIARSLNLSEFTVRNHIHRILRKLQAGSRKEAVNAIRLSKRHLAPKSRDLKVPTEMNEYKKSLREPQSRMSRKVYQGAGAA